jgi:hypothetical protein
MMAEHVIGCNPYAGHLLVFANRLRVPGRGGRDSEVIPGSIPK